MAVLAALNVGSSHARAAVASAAVTTPATAPASTPGRNFAEGVYFTGSDASRVPGYERWLGTSVPLVEIFIDRSSEQNLTTPNWAIDPVTDLGKTVIISWGFFISGSAEGWANAANPANPTSIPGLTYAQRYQAYGTNLITHGQSHAIIRVATEFNNGSGGQPPVMDSATDIQNYKLAFQGFVSTMRAIPGQHFTFVWDTSPDPGDPNDLTRAYPGDASVDAIGLDDYVTTVPWGSNWTTDADQWNRRLNGYHGGKGYQYYLTFAATHNKPVAFPEWGLGWFYSNNGATQSPADNAYFIQQMYTLMTTHNVLFESFWEDGNGLYTTPTDVPVPNASQAFRTTFGGQSASALTPPPNPVASIAGAPSSPAGATATAAAPAAMASRWSGFESLANTVTDSPTVASWSPGRLDVFWVDSGGSLMQEFYSGGWYGPASLGGEWASQPTAVSWGSNRIDIFGQGAGQTLQHFWWDGRSWQGPEVLATGVASAPTVTTWGPGRLDVFYRDSAGHLSQTFYDGSWHTVTNLGGTWTSSPSAVAWAPGRIDILGEGTGGSLQHLWYAGRWSLPETLRPAGSLSAAPSVASWTAGRLDVFWINGSGTLQHLWYAGAWFGTESLGGSLTAAPTAVSWSANRLDIFAEGSDQTLQHVFYN